MSWTNQSRDSSVWAAGAKDAAAWINSAVSLVAYYLLLETGSKLLLENGGGVLLDETFVVGKTPWATQVEH